MPLKFALKLEKKVNVKSVDGIKRMKMGEREREREKYWWCVREGKREIEKV